jgi:spermine oxidase
MLFAFTFGETSRKIERMNRSEMLDGVMFLFDKFLSPRMNYTTPIRIETTKFFSGPNTLGSYSFFSLTTDVFRTAPRYLARPVRDFSLIPRILFAGEACHPNFFSTAHGAVETGYAEADRIINHYKS